LRQSRLVSNPPEEPAGLRLDASVTRTVTAARARLTVSESPAEVCQCRLSECYGWIRHDTVTQASRCEAKPETRTRMRRRSP
jgi:SH3-like domain-containing protein